MCVVSLKKRTCAQKIFAERLPALCRPHAQRTKRLQEALCRLGLKLGGQQEPTLARNKAMSGSRDTILRLVHQSPPDPPKSRIVGVDDWAWKRRLRYGTLICDLERGLPIDLLPDRSVETVSAWFEEHPHVEIACRDGSSEYASAIKKGAPQARQVSDRWHLGKNLSKCVSTLLANALTELRRAEQEKAAPQEGGRTTTIPGAREKALRCNRPNVCVRRSERSVMNRSSRCEPREWELPRLRLR